MVTERPFALCWQARNGKNCYRLQIATAPTMDAEFWDCAKLRLAGTVHRCLSQTERVCAREWKLNRIREGLGNGGDLDSGGGDELWIEKR